MTPLLQSTLNRLTGVPGVVAGSVAHAIVAVVCAAGPGGHTGDFQRYWQLATTPGRPYVDFAAEYPPGALVIFAGMAYAAGDLSGFVQLGLAFNVLADAGIVLLLFRTWGTIAAAAYTWIALPILSLLFFRFDLWPTLCALLALVLLRCGHIRASLMPFAVGVTLKLWPLAFLGLFLPSRRRPSWRAAILAGGSVLAAVALWMSFGGPGGLADVLTYRDATGWHVESTVGSIWYLVDPESARDESGARRVGRIVPLFSIVLGLLTLAAAIWAIARGSLTHNIGTGWVAGIGVLLVGAALMSPQFLGWLLPGAAVAWAEKDRRSAGLVGAVVVLTVGYRVLHAPDVPLWVFLRNVVLIVTAGQAFIRLAAQPAEHDSVLGLEADGPPDRHI